MFSRIFSETEQDSVTLQEALSPVRPGLFDQHKAEFVELIGEPKTTDIFSKALFLQKITNYASDVVTGFLHSYMGNLNTPIMTKLHKCALQGTIQFTPGKPPPRALKRSMLGKFIVNVMLNYNSWDTKTSGAWFRFGRTPQARPPQVAHHN
jgi:hypothetical protein